MGSYSLAGALEAAIDTACRAFAGPWLICGAPPPALTLSPAQAEERFEQSYPADSHPFTEIFFCLEGRCALQIDQDHCRMDRGCVAVLLPGVRHAEMAEKTGGHLALWLTIDRDRCMTHLSGQRVPGHFFTIEGSMLRRVGEYGRLLEGITGETADAGLHAAGFIKSSLLQMLILARREMGDVPQQAVGWKDAIVADALRRIEAGDVRALSLQAVAHATHLSENYLNTLFKAATGKTIARAIGERKINEARRLLLSTDESIQRIASLLGYYDQYHFSKAFKKACGLSPSQYRSQSDILHPERDGIH